MQRTLALLLAFMIAIPAVSNGQDIAIRGRVTDAATGTPLKGAIVRVFNTTTGASSNDSGVFSLTYRRKNQSDSVVDLQAQSLGYTEQRRVVRLTGSQVSADFALRGLPAQNAVTAPSRAMASGAAAAGGAGRGAAGGGRGGGGGGRAGLAAQPGARARPDGPPSLTCTNPASCPNTESYDRIVDNPFLAVGTNAVSTFSIDVDRASLSNIRRFITMGQLPPVDAVRIEEMINYFPYNYEAPGREHPFSVTTEVAAAPWNRQNRLVRIGLQARKIETANLPPSNLVFLVDVSGSMQVANKLPLVKTSLRLLVEQLREQDRVAMVVYAGAAGLVLPPTSGAQKGTILEAIDRLEAGGSTAGGAGLRLAYAVARQFHVSSGNNRIILASDGDFNVGVSSDAEMGRLVEEERKGGTFLTVLGFGMGNLKDSRLETLADKGNGNYAYIDNIGEARKTLVTEMGGTLFTIAKDVKLQVEFNPTMVQAYRLIGYENRMLRAEDFNNDLKDAGELGAGHSVTALYEIVPVGVRSNVAIRGVDSLRYQAPPSRTDAANSSELMFVKLRYKAPTSDTSTLLTHPVPNRPAAMSGDFTFIAAIAEFGMLLRNSEYKGTSTIEDVIGLAQTSLGTDQNGYRADFVQMVRAYERIKSGVSPARGRGGMR